MNNSILEIIIKARDEASAKVAGINKSLKDMEPAFKKMATAGTVAFGALTAVAGTALKEFAEDQAQMALATQELDNTLEQMSANGLNKLQEAAGAGVDIFEALHQEMSRAGQAALKLGFDDEAASAAFAKLFKVTKDTAQANKELQIAMDLARNKGIDLDAAVKILTLTHAGATKELKAQGIAIDENASALENIDKISKSVTGSAGKYAETAKGQWEILTNSINNAKSALGAALAPVLASIVQKIQPVLDKVLAWIEANPELVKQIFLFAAAVSAVVAAAGALGLILPAILSGFSFLLSPVGLVTLAVLAVVAAIVYFRDEIAAFFAIVEEKTGIISFFRETWNALAAVWREQLLPALEKLWEALQPLAPLFELIGQVIGAALMVVLTTFIETLKVIIGVLTEVAKWIMVIYTHILNFLVAGINKAREALSFFSGLFAKFQESAKKAIDAVIAFFQPLIDTVNHLISLMERVAGSIGKVVSAAGGAIKGAASAVGNAVGNVFGGKAQGGPVSGGASYLVGEHGPELFTPGTGGVITPNNALGGAGSIVVNINGGNYLSEEVAMEMGDYIVEALKRVSRIGM